MVNFESSAASDCDRDLFNAYLHSVFTHSSFALPPLEDFSLLSKRFVTLIFLNLKSTIIMLVTLDPTKAMGVDGIGPKLLKHCALAFSNHFISYLFSLNTTFLRSGALVHPPNHSNPQVRRQIFG